MVTASLFIAARLSSTALDVQGAESVVELLVGRFDLFRVGQVWLHLHSPPWGGFGVATVPDVLPSCRGVGAGHPWLYRNDGWTVRATQSKSYPRIPWLDLLVSMVSCGESKVGSGKAAAVSFPSRGCMRAL